MRTKAEDWAFVLILLLVLLAVGWFMPAVGDPRVGYATGLFCGLIAIILFDLWMRGESIA